MVAVAGLEGHPGEAQSKPLLSSRLVRRTTWDLFLARTPFRVSQLLLHAVLSANFPGIPEKASNFLAFLCIGRICTSLMETENERARTAFPGSEWRLPGPAGPMGGSSRNARTSPDVAERGQRRRPLEAANRSERQSHHGTVVEETILGSKLSPPRTRSGVSMTGRFGPGSGSRNGADIRWPIPLSPQTPLTPSAMSLLQAGYGLCGGQRTWTVHKSAEWPQAGFHPPGKWRSHDTA